MVFHYRILHAVRFIFAHATGYTDYIARLGGQYTLVCLFKCVCCYCRYTKQEHFKLVDTVILDCKCIPFNGKTFAYL